ncbi:hypothetical protein [uncultured Enterococcus sp.]|uniref:hypothetical protein n=1 Tax=uncultured Enterococcus sp. TaxID=167972 RepID=UPI002AA61945|nr:hypothetical protein [uncultured Enterococcus sp.]
MEGKTTRDEIADILQKEFNIYSEKDFFDLKEDELGVLYENIKIVQEGSDKTDEEIDEIITEIIIPKNDRYYLIGV